ETWDEGAKRKDQIGVNKLANFGAYAVLHNTKKKPLDDPRVRKAIHLAVSKQDIIKAFQTQEAVNLTRCAAPGGTSATTPDQRALLVEEQKAGNFDMVLDTPGASLPDISLIGGLYWKTGSSRNWGSYSNPKFDALLSQYEVELDEGKRKQMSDDLQNILDDDP